MREIARVGGLRSSLPGVIVARTPTANPGTEDSLLGIEPAECQWVARAMGGGGGGQGGGKGKNG